MSRMKPGQEPAPLRILLADDDTDDSLFFEKALHALPITTHPKTLKDGEELMNYLIENSENLPDVLFLDLAMPRKTGFECLTEISNHEKLKRLPVFVFTTSFLSKMDFETEIKTMLNNMGAQGYIRKNTNSDQLQEVIHNALIGVMEKRTLPAPGQKL